MDRMKPKTRVKVKQGRVQWDLLRFSLEKQIFLDSRTLCLYHNAVQLRCGTFAAPENTIFAGIVRSAGE